MPFLSGMSFAAELAARAKKQEIRRRASLAGGLTPAKNLTSQGKRAGDSGSGEEDEEANDVLDLLNDIGDGSVGSPVAMDEDDIFLRMGGDGSECETDESDVESVRALESELKARGSRERKPSPLSKHRREQADMPSSSAYQCDAEPQKVEQQTVEPQSRSTASAPTLAQKNLASRLVAAEGKPTQALDSPGAFQDSLLRKEQKAAIHAQQTARVQTASTKYDPQQQLAIEFIRRKEQACEWIGQIMSKSLSKRREKESLPRPDTFSQSLRNGVLLCEVVQVINANRAKNMVIHRQYPPATREMRERDNIQAFFTQCMDIGVEKDALFDADDLYESSDVDGGGNLGLVLYTLGVLARVAAAKQLITPDMYWQGHGFRNERGVLMTPKIRDYSQEEVTKASVALLMMDGDAATPILNFTDKISTHPKSSKEATVREKSGSDDDFGQTSSDEEGESRQAPLSAMRRFTRGESVDPGELGEVKKEFKKRLALVKRKLIVTQATVSISDEASSGNVQGARQRNLLSQDSPLTKIAANDADPGGYTSGDELPGRPGIYGIPANNLIVGKNDESALSVSLYTSVPRDSKSPGDISASASGGAGGMPLVASWLTNLGLAEYIPNFEEHGWDDPGSIQRMLTEHELQKIGITKRGHVLRIISNLSKMIPGIGSTRAGTGVVVAQSAPLNPKLSTVEKLPDDLATRWDALKNVVEKEKLESGSDGVGNFACVDDVLRATENLLVPKQAGGRPVILDIGWHSIRIGFAGADRPECVVPCAKGFVKPVFRESVGGKKRRRSERLSLLGEHVVLGDEADLKAEICTLRQPLRRGVDEIACPEKIEWDDLSDLLAYTFDKLDIDPEDHTVLLVESWPNRPVEDREKLIRVLFDTFRVPSLAVLPQGPLVLASYGITTGLVVDIGESSTRALPVFDGRTLSHAATRSPVAGKELTEQTMRMLTFDGFQFDSFARAVRTDGLIPGASWLEQRTAASLKEKLVYASRHLEKSSPLQKSVDATELPAHLQPTLKIASKADFVNWGRHRCEVMECMFNPSLIRGDQYYSQGSLQATIAAAITQLPAPLHRSMYSYIFLTGGTSECPGLPLRLMAELKRITGMDVRVVAPAARMHAAWRGGAMLAARHDFKDNLCISKETYDQGGIGVVLEQIMNISGLCLTENATASIMAGSSCVSGASIEEEIADSNLQRMVKSMVKSIGSASALERHDKITAAIDALTKLTSLFVENMKKADAAQNQVSELKDQLESSRSKWAAADKVRCKAAASACKARLKRAEENASTLKKQLVEQQQMVEMLKDKGLF